jgi:hypothetical protein
VPDPRVRARVNLLMREESGGADPVVGLLVEDAARPFGWRYAARETLAAGAAAAPLAAPAARIAVSDLLP